MPSETAPKSKGFSPDWLVRGILTKIGDIFDRLTGRGFKPSSSLATSELIERMKVLLDAEAENTEGRGFFVPHNIQLKMQWDKFSTDSDESLRKLENELLTAAIDHINDKRYYTYQPLLIEARPDYFTSGVKLFVSFEKIVDEENAKSLNVIVPGSCSTEINVADEEKLPLQSETYILTFTENEKPKSPQIEFIQDQRKGVGRTKENSIAIDDASISKLHASLVLNSSGQLILADTGSTNGTFVNGRRIAYGKAEAIKEGDKVNFGTVEVSFRCVSKPAAEAPVSSTQAPTVSINGFEFSSKTSEQTAPPAPAAVPASVQPQPLQKTIAPNEIVLDALTTDMPKSVAAKESPAPQPAIPVTQESIDLDPADLKEGDNRQ
ncbi:MAG: FHA domain-containing protein [Acidobacteriota bacterium]